MYHQGALEGRCKGADKQDDPPEEDQERPGRSIVRGRAMAEGNEGKRRTGRASASSQLRQGLSIMEQKALLGNKFVWPLCLQAKFIDEVEMIVRKSRRLVLTKDEGW